MTSKFSIDNRDLLQRISSGEAVVGIDFGNLIVRELAAFRLAALDSEPDYNERQLFCSTDTARMKKVISVSAGSGATPLYRHAQPAPVSYSDFEEFWSAYIHPLAQDDELKGFAWDIWCAAMLQAGNSPAQSDCCPAQNSATPAQDGNSPAQSQKWIPVSERMPEVGDIVLTAMGGSVNIGEMECSAANCRFFTSVISGRELPATHWMPLPASPQEVKSES